MLRIVSHSGVVGRIAFSLAHPQARIDVPVRSVLRVDVMDNINFVGLAGEVWSYPDVSVDISVSHDIARRIFRLTTDIVGQPLDIFVSEACLASPVVREPICNFGNFRISAYDLAEAEAMAARIRGAMARPQLRIV